MALGQMNEPAGGLGQGLWNAASGMVGNKGMYSNLGGQSLGIMNAFHEGGFMGAGSRVKSYFGIGYQPTKGLRLGGANIGFGSGVNRYLETIGGRGISTPTEVLHNMNFLGAGAGRITRAELTGGKRALGQYARGLGTTFKTRAGVYGAGAAAGLVLGGSTVGFGSMAVGGGFYLGGSLAGRALGATSVFGGNVAGGSRMGGRVGLGIYGGYKAGKWAGRKLGMW